MEHEITQLDTSKFITSPRRVGYRAIGMGAMAAEQAGAGERATCLDLGRAKGRVRRRLRRGRGRPGVGAARGETITGSRRVILECPRPCSQFPGKRRGSKSGNAEERARHSKKRGPRCPFRAGHGQGSGRKGGQEGDGRTDGRTGSSHARSTRSSGNMLFESGILLQRMMHVAC